MEGREATAGSMEGREAPAESMEGREAPAESTQGREAPAGSDEGGASTHTAQAPVTGPPRTTPASNAEAAAGVESNARLTSGTAAVLFVLFAIEGFTVLRVRSLLTLHVFVGMLLVPPVLLKIATTTWRFVRYYAGAPAYRRKGPPPALLRVLGPVVVILTVVVLATGIALVLAPHSLRHPLLFLHKASFILWFGAMTVHVLGHLVETARLAPRDWVRRTRRDVAGAGARQWAIAASVIAGAGLGILMLGPTSRYLPHF